MPLFCFRALSATAVTMSWKEHVPNPDIVPGTDFRQINRQAIIEGKISARDQDEFRKQNAKKPEYRLKVGHVRESRPALPLPPRARCLWLECLLLRSLLLCLLRFSRS
eukprot:SAG22_NODE_3351_length_1763_cov_2.019832_2_plen_108_part_00